MSGSKHKRLDNSLTDPSPGLRGPAESQLQNFLGNPSSWLQGIPGSQPSALQTQTQNSFSQLLNSWGQGAPEGQGILDAAQPIFQRNLQQGADVLRQSGPRFNSNTERLVGDQNQKALQDFNLFGQNVLEAGRNRQLSTLFGAGEFANQMQGQQNSFNLPLIQQLLGTSFAGGGITQQPTVVEQKPWWQQAVGVAATLAPYAAAPFTGGASLGLAGAGAKVGQSMMGGGVVSGPGMGTAPAPNYQNQQPWWTNPYGYGMNP